MSRELNGAEEYAWQPPTEEANASWQLLDPDARRFWYERWTQWQRSDRCQRMLSDYVAAAATLVETAIAVQQVAEQSERKDRPPHPAERDGAERHALAMMRRCDRLVRRAALWWVTSSGRYQPQQDTIDDLVGADVPLAGEGSEHHDERA